MSASRERQNRQKQHENADWIAPKTAREAQQRNEERRSNLLYGTIGVIFLAVVIASVIWNSNIIPRMSTAATVDGQKYNAAQVSFYYRNAYFNLVNNWSYILSYIGLDTSQPLDEQFISATAAGFIDAEEGTSWKEYFMEQGLEEIASVQNGLKQAAEENFTFPDSVQENFNDSMNSLTSAARSRGATVARYLQNAFGVVMTEKIYRTELLRLMQYEAYTTAYRDGLTYTTEELEKAYSENPNDYDLVSYEAVTFSGSAPSTLDDDGNAIEPTEEEQEEAMTAARAKAEAFANDYRNGGTLQELSEKTDGASYTEDDGLTYSESPLDDWLFAHDRRTGDVSVVESGTTFYVARFRERYRDETKTIDVRHILIEPEDGELDSEDEGYDEEQETLKAAAKEKAEALYKEWQDGEKTEESFATLAEENSDDSGSAENGGLYEQVAEGDMVAEFNDWCFDPTRKSGDTGIVETSYGYHIMYYVSDDLPHWQVQVTDDLKSDDYQTWTDAFSEDASIETNDFGMGFID